MADRGLVEPTAEIVERAAQWLAHLESGDADEIDTADFTAWRESHPAHALAAARLGIIGDRLRDGSASERETIRRLFLRPQRRVAIAAITALAIGAGWLLTSLPVVRWYLADDRTSSGETRTIALADGSDVVLGSLSAIDVDNKRRTVSLLRGELLARVKKGHPQRFIVRTQDGSAEALGTAFTVRRNAQETVIAVASSHVRACPRDRAPAGCLTLSPGQQARITATGVVRLGDVSPRDVGAWIEGWLPIEDRPLAEVLDELGRWREKPLQFDRAALADLRVSGVFPLRDTTAALANLARSQPITVDTGDPSAPVIRRRAE